MRCVINKRNQNNAFQISHERHTPIQIHRMLNSVATTHAIVSQTPLKQLFPSQSSYLY